VTGADKNRCGADSFEYKVYQPVEPYKGKGIKYMDSMSEGKPGKPRQKRPLDRILKRDTDNEK